MEEQKRFKDFAEEEGPLGAKYGAEYNKTGMVLAT